MKNRISDAIYRMKKRGFRVPADIRKKAKLSNEMTYEQLYESISPYTVFPGKDRPDISGYEAYQLWKAEREYRKLRTRIRKGHEPVLEVPPTLKPFEELGPGPTERAARGIDEEEAERKREKAFRAQKKLYEEEIAKIRGVSEHELEVERAKASLIKAVEIQLKGIIPEDLYNKITTAINDADTETFWNMWDKTDNPYTKMINSIFSYDTGIILTGDSGFKSDTGGIMTPLVKLMDIFGEKELITEIEDLVRQNLTGNLIVRTQAKKSKIAAEEKRKRRAMRQN